MKRVGNAFTGDVTALAKHMMQVRLDGNWLLGRWSEFPEMEVQAKVFSEPSGFGIGNGRISKLWVANTSHKPVDPLLNYDRGWDLKPRSKDAKKVLRVIYAALQ